MSQAVPYEDRSQQSTTYLGGLSYFYFLNISIYCYELSLRTSFAVSHRFWCMVCLFSFFLSILFFFFFISLSISSLTHWFFRTALFNFNMSVNFSAFPLNVDFQLHTIVVRKDTWHFNFSKFAMTCFLPSIRIYHGDSFMCT